MALESFEALKEQIRNELEVKLRAEMLEQAKKELAEKNERYLEAHRKSMASLHEQKMGELEFARRKAESLIQTREQALAALKPGDPSFLWSTCLFQSGSQLQNVDRCIFTTQLGCTGQGFPRPCGIAETNMREGGRLPAGTGLQIRGVTVELWGCANDIELFQRIGVLCIDRLQTMVDLFPLGALKWERDLNPKTNEYTGCARAEWHASFDAARDSMMAQALSLHGNDTFAVALRLGHGLGSYDHNCRLVEDLMVRVTLRGTMTIPDSMSSGLGISVGAGGLGAGGMGSGRRSIDPASVMMFGGPPSTESMVSSHLDRVLGGQPSDPDSKV